MTFRKAQHSFLGYFKRATGYFKDDTAGAVAIEFAICMVIFIPLFLATIDYTRIISVKKTADEVGSSALRAIAHVPEYDKKMRNALDVLCRVHKTPSDEIYIEIMSATLDSGSFVINWIDMPCGRPANYIPVTEANLDSNFSNLDLRQGESIIIAKASYVAGSLSNSKYIFGPADDTFIFFNAATPRIANSVLFTESDLYDIKTYEY